MASGTDPDDPRRDLQVAQHERDLEGDDEHGGDDQGPRLQPAQERVQDPAREHVVAPGARHHRGQRGEDHRQQDAEQPGDDRGPAIGGEGSRPPDVHIRERIEDRVQRESNADERGDVEEQRIGHAHVANQP